MRDLICDTSVLQYLHQLRLLEILRKLGGRVLVPSAVNDEIQVGLRNRVDLPNLAAIGWVEIRKCVIAAHQVAAQLGTGEAAVLSLASECHGSIVVLDDAPARRMAAALGLPFTGTLGLLIDAKKIGAIASVRECVDQLHQLCFRLSNKTRTFVLEIAGEES
ncbi:MAG: DUF3368 domain-containing protein [Planctomycetes bacterium]|nr:DUF3368 domain-containing protein [Planctomycetota bacterium]